jgi:hypothetical protein
MKSQRLEIMIPKWIKDALRADAEKKGVSMAEVIKDRLKQQYIDEKGNIKPEYRKDE